MASLIVDTNNIITLNIINILWAERNDFKLCLILVYLGTYLDS